MWQQQQTETEVCQVREKLLLKLKKTDGRQLRGHNEIKRLAGNLNPEAFIKRMEQYK